MIRRDMLLPNELLRTTRIENVASLPRSISPRPKSHNPVCMKRLGKDNGRCRSNTSDGQLRGESLLQRSRKAGIS